VRDHTVLPVPRPDVRNGFRLRHRLPAAVLRQYGLRDRMLQYGSPSLPSVHLLQLRGWGFGMRGRGELLPGEHMPHVHRRRGWTVLVLRRLRQTDRLHVRLLLADNPRSHARCMRTLPISERVYSKSRSQNRGSKGSE
jgi:hypothetical protein